MAKFRIRERVSVIKTDKYTGHDASNWSLKKSSNLRIIADWSQNEIFVTDQKVNRKFTYFFFANPSERLLAKRFAIARFASPLHFLSSAIATWNRSALAQKYYVDVNISDPMNSNELGNLSDESHFHNVGNVRLFEGVSWSRLGSCWSRCRCTGAPRFRFSGVHAVVRGRPENNDVDKSQVHSNYQIQTSQAPQPAVCPQGFLLLWQKLSELPPLLHHLLQLLKAWGKVWDEILNTKVNSLGLSEHSAVSSLGKLFRTTKCKINQKLKAFCCHRSGLVQTRHLGWDKGFMKKGVKILQQLIYPAAFRWDVESLW